MLPHLIPPAILSMNGHYNTDFGIDVAIDVLKEEEEGQSQETVYAGHVQSKSLHVPTTINNKY